MQARMRQISPWHLLSACALAGCLPVAVSCGGGGGDAVQIGTTTVAPVITAQPASATVTAGQPASFSVTATGTAPLSYQWKKDGAALSGATSATYAIVAASTADAGSYVVTITNAAGHVDSSAATLTVNPAAVAPSITAQPASATVTAGQPASFSVTATGTAPLSYQWKKDGVVLSGATSATYAIVAASAADAGSYVVTITNAAGHVDSSAATLTVNPAVTAPAITAQPQVQNVMVGDPATFSVTATGDGLSYQWKRSGNVIQGATAASYTLANTAISDDGATFSVQVSNAGGSVTSDGAPLHVWPAGSLNITKQPVSQTSLAPDGATFTVTAVGTNLKYQWQKNGTAISGATSSSYTTGATDLHEKSALYNVVVSSGGSSVTSENATHTIMAPNPTYAGDPVAMPSRPLTTLPSYNVDAAFPKGAFRFGYDEALKDPVWTAYADFKFITAFDNGDRNFLPDDRLAPPQVTDDDYSGNSGGWTRGHQAMMSDVAYRYGSQAGQDTCRLSNICPQSATHNNNFWNNLEQIVGGSNPSNWVPGLADKFNRIWVYTGPVFDATPARFGTKNIAIPSGFWKIVVRESAGQPKALAILSPHAYTPPNEDLWKYVTSVARIEDMAGLNLFPTPASPLPATFKTEVDVRGWGTPFEQTTKPNVHIVNPSWDESVAVGTPVTFVGAATSSNSTVASTSWTFGDGGTATTDSATHTFNTGGTYNVTYTATDALGVSNAITRVITVTGGNAAPTVTGLPVSDSTAVDTPKDLPFTVSDDVTPLSVTFVASSSNTAVVANSGLTFTGTSASQILHIVPVAGATGSTTLTVQVTDGNGATTTKTIAFAVGTTPPAAGLTENFTWAGTGTTYATSDFTLSTGSWHFVTTLSIKSDPSDAENDGQGLRMKKDVAGSAVWMNFDYGTAGNTVSTVTVAYGVYKSDAAASKTASFSLYASTDQGTTWTKVGDSVTASSNTLSTATFGGLTLSAPVRFKLAVDGTPTARLNLDDFTVR